MSWRAMSWRAMSWRAKQKATHSAPATRCSRAALSRGTHPTLTLTRTRTLTLTLTLLLAGCLVTR